jgi:glycine cleavage system H protein
MGLSVGFRGLVLGNREGSLMLARDESPLKYTPLHALHVARGGKMVPFAGYDMPVQYAAGVLREHLHTRNAAGLFDVSHMGQLALRPKSGKVLAAALALERLVPADIVAVAPGRQRYAQFTDASGGILDDLMVANFGDHLFLVVNAACKVEDEAHLRANLSDVCVIDSLADRALIALQGPKAEAALTKFCADAAAMKFMDAGPRRVGGYDCFVSRSGYTGEDGFEISVPAEHAEALATALLENSDVLPIGLGARDSLRLEAGLCLYGTTSTPRRHRSKARWNGRSRKAAATVARARAVFPARKRFFRSLRTALRAAASACARKAARRCAKARSCLRMRHRASKSARSRQAALARASMRRWRWAICPLHSPPSARPSSLRCADNACRSRSQPCPSFPIPINARGSSMTTLFTSDHEWLRIEGDVATIGVTDYAQSQLGDVVFVELPKVGRSLKKAEAAAVVESVKAASDVYAPISGEVLEVNDALAAEPALVNSDAAGKAWFFKLKIANKSELDGLMDEAAYAKHTA